MAAQQRQDRTVDAIPPAAVTEAESRQLLPQSQRDSISRRVTFQDCNESSETPPRTVWRVVRAIAIGIFHISFSAGVIIFNKYTLDPQRFPHAVVLTTFQVACSFSFGKMLSKFAPGLFPSARMVLERKYVRNDIAAWAFLPIGVCSAVATTCANIAYLHAPVSFLQMVREPVVVWVYLLTVMNGLERISYRNLMILGTVLFTSTVAVTHARPVAWAGLVLMLVSSVAQATQAVLTSRLMTRAMGLKVDPLSMMLVCAPVVLLLLFPVTLMLWDKALTTQLLVSWRVVCLNVILTFALQLINAITIRVLSATGLACVAVLKDVSIVGLAVILLGDRLSMVQLFGFIGCIAAVATYSVLKVHPDLCEANRPSTEP